MAPKQWRSGASVLLARGHQPLHAFLQALARLGATGLDLPNAILDPLQACGG